MTGVFMFFKKDIENRKNELESIKKRMLEIMVDIRQHPPILEENQAVLNICLKTIIEIDEHLNNKINPALGQMTLGI